MNCPNCDIQLGVYRTTRTESAVIRERRCDQCGSRFATREQMTSDQPLKRPSPAQGIVYEMLFHARQATVMQLSRLSGMSYGRTLYAVSRLVDSGLATQPQRGRYAYVEFKNGSSRTDGAI